LSGSSQVKPGNLASFAVWVWTRKAPGRNVSVALQVASAKALGAPRFSVCPILDSATCKLGTLATAQADELRAVVPVGAKAARNEQVQLTVTMTAKGAKSVSGWASDIVVRASSATAPPGSTPTLPPTVLPGIPGTGVSPRSPTNPSSLFPTVGPAPSTSPSPLGLPTVKPKKRLVHLTDAATTVPLDPRLIGGQLAGLAVLAGGVAIAIARLSLRSPKSEDKGKSPTQ